MADLAFQQTDRSARSVLVPISIAAVVLAGVAAAIYFISPHTPSKITVSKTEIYPAHIQYSQDQGTIKLLGKTNTAEDDLYVMPTVHIHNNLDIPIDINDLRGTFTTESGEVVESSAVQKNDVAAVTTIFPEVGTRAGKDLLLRESTIPAKGDLTGTVILCFKDLKQSDWDKRKSVTATVIFYKLGPYTVELSQ